MTWRSIPTGWPLNQELNALHLEANVITYSAALSCLAGKSQLLGSYNA